ncbi:hypothetical protein OG500_32905 [Kitasatospora sp. NBC_01250]|nr:MULTISPECIES: hypothetical protein [unclassified Kitasatospora]WSJ70785.1 hypothetical protein OG294_34445 [Kitasatospora sp. NBC_01302]
MGRWKRSRPGVCADAASLDVCADAASLLDTAYHSPAAAAFAQEYAA